MKRAFPLLALVPFFLSAVIAEAQVDPRDARLIFVTSSDQNGNLGGLARADDLCNRLAGDAGLGSRSFKAVLSTTTLDAVDRFVDDGYHVSASSIPSSGC